MNNKLKVYFRADGNATTGLGHVFRSLALAEMLSDTFDCHFIIQNPLEVLETQILNVCNSILKIPETTDIIQEANTLVTQFQANEIIVLDGYHFNTAYQRIFKNKDIKVVCIDDNCSYHFVADAIINHAGGIKKWQYHFEKYTKLFLGLKYALLRKPFREAAKIKIKKPNNLFICLGGADPKNHTLEVLKKVEQSKETNTCFLVIGGAYIYKSDLEDFLKNTTLKIEVLSNLSADKMVFYMNQCARAITPPSTVSYEYLSTGGILFLKVIANNQININSYFLEEKLALSFDENFEKYDADAITPFIKKQAQLFDGKQRKRFRNIFYRLTTSTRLARLNDCKIYFDWANDPITRQQSYHSEPIHYENHEAWFKQRLEDTNSILYIVDFNKKSIGQIRFQIKNNIATINYSLDKNYRGKGLGFWIVKKGINSFRKNYPNHDIIGFVKFDNIASAKIFRNLGFRETVSTKIKNSYKYFY